MTNSIVKPAGIAVFLFLLLALAWLGFRQPETSSATVEEDLPASQFLK